MNRTAPKPISRPKLARFIWERMLTLEEVATALGCSYEQVRVISRPFADQARRVPGPELMARIVEWTEGEVTPADFYPPHLTPARPPLPPSEVAAQQDAWAG